jgi:hypothetical protein
MSFYAIIGHGPNDLQIPLVICATKQEAQAIVERIPKEAGDDWLEESFTECVAPYTDDDHEQTPLGKELYSLIFKDGTYYSGCGGVYHLSVVEYEYGQPMVGWDLD